MMLHVTSPFLTIMHELIPTQGSPHANVLLQACGAQSMVKILALLMAAIQSHLLMVVVVVEGIAIGAVRRFEQRHMLLLRCHLS